MDGDVHGIIVSGEASESDEDEELFYSSKQVVPTRSPKNAQPIKKIDTKRSSNRHNSLLHQKLWEANVSLHKNLCNEHKTPISSCAIQISKLGCNVAALQASSHIVKSKLNQSSKNVELILEQLSVINNDHLPRIRPHK